VILVANHPTYIDAVLMMSQWHNLFCLTKVDVMANPWVAAMARSAGYESNVNPSQLIENCVRRLREGENLLVFPEGTRTTTPPIGSLKRGFAVVAGEAQAPVVPIIVTTQNGTFLSKGQPFFVLFPPLPLSYRFSLGPEFRLEPNESARDFCQRVENYFRAKISSELLS
jgi:1-acyl-sn-glycerol-3-phosphate acyltransferase